MYQGGFMELEIIQGDFRHSLPQVSKFKMLFADPPDNVGLTYETYDDRLSDEDYRRLLEDTIGYGMANAEILWISYNARHMNLMGSILHECEKNTNWRIRHLVQHVTFGYCARKDFSHCFRPLVRIMQPKAITYPEAVLIPSDRQIKYNDPRAAKGGKIPPDVWTISRVTGNSKQRRSWHHTQLNEELYERCLKFSATTGDRVGDLYAGTGTMARAARGLGMDVSLFELCPDYCGRMSEEFGVPVTRLDTEEV